jgi:glycosyltransferase involved in cell wall biosynthesis
MALRVGINAAFLAHPDTGSGQYLTHLVARLGGGHTYHLLADRPGPAGTVACVPGWLRGRQARKLYLEQLGAPLAARRERLDLLHYPYFAAPAYSPAPVVVTVHDLIPLLLPHYRGSALARAYTALAAVTTRRARTIICDSACSQRDVLRLLGVPAERTRVVYLAAAPEMRPASEAEMEAVRQRFGLGERFVFYVGGLDRRKNLAVLLRAFARLLADHPDAELAIAGRQVSRGALFPDWQGYAGRLGIAGRVRFLGRVSEEEKAALYSASRAFAFPSLYEGFGLPPLEAMACGSPVLCADTSSLPEVVGEAGLLLPAGDDAAWAEALHRVWEDAELRAELRERGLARAAQFSWQKTAEETREVYECALS